MRVIDNNSILRNGKTFKELRDFARKSNVALPFETIFGDLSECAFSGNLSLRGMSLTSLKGMPFEIRDGLFDCSSLAKLESLEYFPKKLAANKIVYISLTSYIPCFKFLEPETFENCEIVIIEESLLTPIEAVVIFSNFRKRQGGFSNLRNRFDYPAYQSSNLEKLYNLYEKLHFDQEKFFKLEKLL